MEKILNMRIIFIVLLIVGWGILVACSREAPTIRFVVPSGFRGLFLVVEDKINGQEVKKINGEIVFYIGKEGHVSIKDLKVFNSWHKLRGQFQDGESLPPYSEVPNAKVAIFAVGSVPDIGRYYFIGAQTQYDKISKQWDLSTLPLAQELKLD